MKIRSDKMRKAAKGEQCTFNIVGVCSYDPATTTLCHLPDESHGMARKSDDLSSAFGCAECHAVIDGRAPHYFEPGEKDWYMRRAQTRTIRRCVEIGVIKVEGVA